MINIFKKFCLSCVTQNARLFVGKLESEFGKSIDKAGTLETPHNLLALVDAVTGIDDPEVRKLSSAWEQVATLVAALCSEGSILMNFAPGTGPLDGPTLRKLKEAFKRCQKPKYAAKLSVQSADIWSRLSVSVREGLEVVQRALAACLIDEAEHDLAVCGHGHSIEQRRSAFESFMEKLKQLGEYNVSGSNTEGVRLLIERSVDAATEMFVDFLQNPGDELPYAKAEFLARRLRNLAQNGELTPEKNAVMETQLAAIKERDEVRAFEVGLAKIRTALDQPGESTDIDIKDLINAKIPPTKYEATRELVRSATRRLELALCAEVPAPALSAGPWPSC